MMTTRRFFLLLMLWGSLYAAQPALAQDAAPTASLPQCPTLPFVWPGEFFFSPDFATDQTVVVRGRDTVESPRALFRSVDGGRFWQHFADVDLGSLRFSPQYSIDRTVFGLQNPYLTRSTDAGATWRPLITIPLRQPLYGVTFVVVNADTLFFGLFGGPPPPPNERGLFLSTDAGVTWTQRFDLAGVRDIALSPHYAEDQTLFISAINYKINYGIYRSTDAGLTWAERNDNLYLSGGASCKDLAFSPGFATDRTLFATCTGLGYRSTDAGDSWQLVYPAEIPDDRPAPWGHEHWTLSPTFVRDRTAWLDHGELLTTDAGATWEEHPHELTMYEGLAAVQQCNAAGACGVVLVGGKSTRGIYYSYDLGRTWHCPQEDVTPPWAAPPAEIPEPTTWLLLGSGLAALAGWAQRRR